MELVVAFYKTYDFLDLVDALDPSVSVIVYDKSPNGVEIPEKYKNIKIVNLSNIGGESDTYLNHIIMNYEYLTDNTVFIQDDIHNHIKIPEFLEFISDTLKNGKPFNSYPAAFRPNQREETRTVKNGSVFICKPTPRDIVLRLSKRIGFTIEKEYTTHICAFFMCHRDAITQRSVDFYKKCLYDLNEDETETPWVTGCGFEHAWCQIFNLKTTDVESEMSDKRPTPIPGEYIQTCNLNNLFKDKIVAIIGPAKELETTDYSEFLKDCDTIVRINVKLVDKKAYLPDEIKKHTHPRTDIVYHHCARVGSNFPLCSRVVQSWPETSLGFDLVKAYKTEGIEHIVCAEPGRNKHAMMYEDCLNVYKLHEKTPTRLISTGYKAILDVLNYNPQKLKIVGMDFNQSLKDGYGFGRYTELSSPPGMNDMLTNENWLKNRGGHNFQSEFEKFIELMKTDKRIEITEYLENYVEIFKKRIEDKEKYEAEQKRIADANRKCIVVTPAGRRQYLEKLKRHLLKQKDDFHEWHLWFNVIDESVRKPFDSDPKADKEYIEKLAKEYDWIKIIKLPLERTDGNYRNLFVFYHQCTDPNTVYIKLDDDIVWLEGGFIKEMKQFRMDNPEYFITYGNTVNNQCIDHVHQRIGALQSIDRFIDYNMKGWIWTTPSYAINVLKQFIKDRKEGSLNKWKFDRWVTRPNLGPQERVSINAISWIGNDHMKKIPREDEAWLSCDGPRQMNPVKFNGICGKKLCVHFSFGPQRSEELEKILDEVADI